jgi:hypothetical protein
MTHDEFIAINSDIDKVELFLLALYLYELDKLIDKLEKYLDVQ